MENAALRVLMSKHFVPDQTFTILGTQNPEIGELFVLSKSLSRDVEAPKL